MMGYQPVSRGYMEKYLEVEQELKRLQLQNNQLVGEIAKMKERERLGIEKADPRQELEELEDKLWNAQDNLRLEKNYTYGFATATVTFGLTSGAAWWMSSLFENNLILFLGCVGVVLATLCLIITFTKIFGALPEVRKEIAGYQRRVNRLTLKEMGIQ